MTYQMPFKYRDTAKEVGVDLPTFGILLPPTPTACKVIDLAARNHQDDLPFDLRAVPNQWLINERARSASLGERILELEQRVRRLEQER